MQFHLSHRGCDGVEVSVSASYSKDLSSILVDYRAFSVFVLYCKIFVLETVSLFDRPKNFLCSWVVNLSRLIKEAKVTNYKSYNTTVPMF